MIFLGIYIVTINILRAPVGLRVEYRFYHMYLFHSRCLLISYIKKLTCSTIVAQVIRYVQLTRSSAIAEGPRDASFQLKSCQLSRNSAETTYTTSPDQIDGMKLEI